MFLASICIREISSSLFSLYLQYHCSHGVCRRMVDPSSLYPQRKAVKLSDHVRHLQVLGKSCAFGLLIHYLFLAFSIDIYFRLRQEFGQYFGSYCVYLISR